MPEVNGNYVAPNWRNNNSPAIDAGELNAMSRHVQYPARKISLSLSTAWAGTASPFTQSVTGVSGITANSQVDLQPDAAVISRLIADKVSAVYIGNDGGTLTAYAVGAKPTAVLTVQATVTEVNNQ